MPGNVLTVGYGLLLKKHRDKKKEGYKSGSIYSEKGRIV
jgi:hypothetical protein